MDVGEQLNHMANVTYAQTSDPYERYIIQTACNNLQYNPDSKDGRFHIELFYVALRTKMRQENMFNVQAEDLTQRQATYLALYYALSYMLGIYSINPNYKLLPNEYDAKMKYYISIFYNNKQ
jgi:hypothetical protein